MASKRVDDLVQTIKGIIVVDLRVIDFDLVVDGSSVFQDTKILVVFRIIGVFSVSLVTVQEPKPPTVAVENSCIRVSVRGLNFLVDPVMRSVSISRIVAEVPERIAVKG